MLNWREDWIRSHLMDERNPTPMGRVALTVNEVSAVRNLSCRFYDVCLSQCTRLGWASFTCVSCHRFREPTGQDDMADQALRRVSER
jgi:hypothetical protein